MNIYNEDYFIKYFPAYIAKKYNLPTPIIKKISSDGGNYLTIKVSFATLPFRISPIENFCGGVFISCFARFAEKQAETILSIVDDFCILNGYSNAFLIFSEENGPDEVFFPVLERNKWKKAFKMDNVRTENECFFFRKKYDIDKDAYEDGSLLKALKEI